MSKRLYILPLYAIAQMLGALAASAAPTISNELEWGPLFAQPYAEVMWPDDLIGEVTIVAGASEADRFVYKIVSEETISFWHYDVSAATPRFIRTLESYSERKGFALNSPGDIAFHTDSCTAWALSGCSNTRVLDHCAGDAFSLAYFSASDQYIWIDTQVSSLGGSIVVYNPKNPFIRKEWDTAFGNFSDIGFASLSSGLVEHERLSDVLTFDAFDSSNNRYVPIAQITIDPSYWKYAGDTLLMAGRESSDTLRSNLYYWRPTMPAVVMLTSYGEGQPGIAGIALTALGDFAASIELSSPTEGSIMITNLNTLERRAVHSFILETAVTSPKHWDIVWDPTGNYVAYRDDVNLIRIHLESGDVVSTGKENYGQLKLSPQGAIAVEWRESAEYGNSGRAFNFEMGLPVYVANSLTEKLASSFWVNKEGTGNAWLRKADLKTLEVGDFSNREELYVRTFFPISHGDLLAVTGKVNGESRNRSFLVMTGEDTPDLTDTSNDAPEPDTELGHVCDLVENVDVWDTDLDGLLSYSEAVTRWPTMTANQYLEFRQYNGAVPLASLVQRLGLNQYHSADTNTSGSIELSELLRVVQFFSVGAYDYASAGSEDGFEPGQGPSSWRHSADVQAPFGEIDLGELLGVVQLYNANLYATCETSLSTFCPVL